MQMTASRVADLPLGTSQPFYYLLADVRDAARLATTAGSSPVAAAAVADASPDDSSSDAVMDARSVAVAAASGSHLGGASTIVDVTIEHDAEAEATSSGNSRSSAIEYESSDDEEGEVAALYASCARNDEEAAMLDALTLSAGGAPAGTSSSDRTSGRRAGAPSLPQSGRGVRGRAGKSGGADSASPGLSACSGTLALRPLYVAQENIRLLSSPQPTAGATVDAATAVACAVRHPLLSSYFVNFRLADGCFTPRPDVVDTAYPDDALCMVASNLSELADWSCSQPRLGKTGRGAASAVVDAALLSSMSLGMGGGGERLA